MPLVPFSYLKDNTRLIKHGNTLYKVKVKYDRNSFKGGKMTITESETHEEIENVLRAVLYMLERNKKPKPILSHHFLIYISIVPWSFLTRYKNIVFTKDDKVLKVYNDMLEFDVKRNVIDKVPKQRELQGTADKIPDRNEKMSGKTAKPADHDKPEKDDSIIRNKNDGEKEKRKRTVYASNEHELIDTVYTAEESAVNQRGSRFYRDEKGKLCRLVNKAPSGNQNKNVKTISGKPLKSPAKTVSYEKDIPPGKSVLKSPGRKEKPAIHTQPSGEKSDRMKLRKRPNQGAENIFSPRRNRRNSRLKVMQHQHKGQRNLPKPVTRIEKRRLHVKDSDEYLSSSSKSKSEIKKMKVQRQKRKQDENQSTTDIDSDLEPSSSKRRKTRNSSNLSARLDQKSPSRTLHQKRKGLRRSGRLSGRRNDVSTEYETEVTTSSSSGNQSDSDKRSRKRKLYVTRSSPQAFAVNGAKPKDSILQSPRISTVRPVKRDSSGIIAHGPATRRADVSGQQTVNSSTRADTQQSQMEEMQRMERLRSPIGSPAARNRDPAQQYRSLLHGRMDRHAVEQAEREETTKLCKLYEPTVPRRSPRHIAKKERRRSSGIWGKIMDTLVTPTKNLFGRK